VDYPDLADLVEAELARIELRLPVAHRPPGRLQATLRVDVRLVELVVEEEQQPVAREQPVDVGGGDGREVDLGDELVHGVAIRRQDPHERSDREEARAGGRHLDMAGRPFEADGGAWPATDPTLPEVARRRAVRSQPDRRSCDAHQLVAEGCQDGVSADGFDQVA